jgi:hypothetical protein
MGWDREQGAAEGVPYPISGVWGSDPTPRRCLLFYGMIAEMIGPQGPSPSLPPLLFS